jgi:hypothetical protein
MPDGDIDLIDILLFGMPAALLTVFGFVCLLEGWRRWSENH